MDTRLSLQLQLQQAWLHTQLNKRIPPSPLPSPAQPPSPPHFTPWSPSGDVWSTPDSTSWPSLQSELAALSESWEHGDLPTSSSSSSSSTDSWGGSYSSSTDSWGGSYSPYRGPSSASSDPWMPGNQHVQTMAAAAEPPPAAGAAAAYPATDMLMDPVLEFISDMLMDEQMENRKCMRQECTAYQAIANGFYQVLGDDSSPQSSYCSEQSPGLGSFPGKIREEPGTEDYSWIDQVLVADPSPEEGAGAQSWPLEHTSPVFNGFEQDPKLWAWPLESSSSSSSEQDLKVWSLDSSSSGSPYSQDSPSGPLEHTFGIFPTPAVVPPQSHISIAPSLPRLPALQTIPHKDFMPSQADGNGFFFEGPSPPLPPSELIFGGFRNVKSEKLPANTAESFLLSILKEDEFKKVTSDMLIEMGKQSESRDAPSKVADEQRVSFVNNKDLNAEKNAKIYGDQSAAYVQRLAKKKQAREANVKRNGKPEPVDLRALLVDCAQAVGANNLRKANDIVQELQQHASQYGSAAQRTAHYFTEGLLARLSGTGARLYTAMSNNRPSAANMLKAFRLMVEVCPYLKLAHFFANQSILKAAEGASRVHIVDYGILYGLQWPCLISALAERKGGPPFLRITGIEFPQPGVNPAERIEETGRRLAEYARAYNVPFQYHAIASKWEDVEPAALNLKKGEILVVNCIHRLRHLMDETVVSASPRRKVLSRIRSLNPNMVLIAIMNAGFNAPFFVSRFREALYHYSSKFDMMDTTVADSENPQRLMMERECLGRDILNVVACEGPERVERPETYRQWQARFQRSGFESFPLDQSVLSKARDVVKACYHKDFSVDDDSKWMLLGWKGRIVEGLSAWKPSGR